MQTDRTAWSALRYHERSGNGSSVYGKSRSDNGHTEGVVPGKWGSLPLSWPSCSVTVAVPSVPRLWASLAPSEPDRRGQRECHAGFRREADLEFPRGRGAGGSSGASS
jgi:hypothetical protein